MSRANNSSIEMDNGLKIAFQARSKQNTYGISTDHGQDEEVGKRKEANARQKAKAKAKAKMAKKSKRKNK